MMIQKTIEYKLTEAFAPAFLEVENESHRHSVAPGSESHFKVTVVSGQFEGLKLRERHQAVYQVLEEELSGGVHALSIRAQTPEQWEAAGGKTHQTPDCRRRWSGEDEGEFGVASLTHKRLVKASGVAKLFSRCVTEGPLWPPRSRGLSLQRCRCLLS
jgi:BolA protein